MLFTELPPPPPFPTTPAFPHYAPTKSSPLAPRFLPTQMAPQSSNNNTTASSSAAGTFNFNFAPPASSTTSSSSSPSIFTPTTANTSNNKNNTTPPTKYAHRYTTTITNPLKQFKTSSTSPTLRDKRRAAFLNRVKQDREDGRFNNRGERFMLLEHVEERKIWGEMMRRSADGIVRGFGLDGDGDVDVEEGNMEVMEEDEEDRGAEVEELAEYIQQEHDFERALLEEEEEEARWKAQEDTRGNRGSFSDDEYDGIFMDLAEGQGMDMSSG